jgi:hypothetical protein
MVCRITVHALCAAMVILVDTGIVKKALVPIARADKALSILAKLIV